MLYKNTLADWLLKTVFLIGCFDTPNLPMLSISTVVNFLEGHPLLRDTRPRK